MLPKLYIVVGSKFKYDDLSAKLNEYFDCEQKIIKEPEIQGTPDEIIRHKVKKAYEIFQHPVLVDDVSVDMEALNGFPGPYMKDFWNHFTPYELGQKFNGTRINSTCRLALMRGADDLIIAEGTFHGTIVAPKDNEHKGRWFELCVKLDGMDKVMLEYDPSEYYEQSHRGRAMKNLIEILESKKKK